MDIWGRIYRDHYEGDVHPHVIERDDGLEHQVESAEAYFKAPRSEMERQYLEALDGPVLDVGAGVGSHALYLEARGLEVTAVDSSEGAIEICQRRGCRDARVMDLRSLALQAGHYSSFIVMGNTLGIHQTPETLPILLRTLALAARPRARLFCVMLDPLVSFSINTDDPGPFGCSMQSEMELAVRTFDLTVEDRAAIRANTWRARFARTANIDPP